jgi:broad specificity phosphatase PhoE
MYSFTFLRHGESIGNISGIIQGQFNSPLSSNGISQAQNLAAFWNRTNVRFNLIVTSPLSRALETAKVISEALAAPLVIDDLWKERTFGVIEGKMLEELQQSEPAINFYHPYNPPAVNAESPLDLYARAAKAIQNLLILPEANYLIVSHGAFLNMVMYVIMGLTPIANINSPRFVFENTGYAEFAYNPVNLQWRLNSFQSNKFSSSG